MHLAVRSRALVALLLGFAFTSLAAAQVPTSLAAFQEHELEASERIEKALAEHTTLEFVDTELKDVIAFLADLHGITIVLANKIEDAGIEPTKLVTMRLKSVSLESALNRLLGNLNLMFMVKDEVLIITTIEDAQSPENLVTRLYPVADLVRSPEGYNDFDPLIDLVTSTIEPDSWQDVGGPGSISGFDNALCLVFTNRRETHQRMEALLATLRRVKRIQNISSPTASASSETTPPLSRSLPVPKRPSSSGRLQTPAEAARQFSGGFFSVPNR